MIFLRVPPLHGVALSAVSFAALHWQKDAAAIANAICLKQGMLN
jgi:hypothetical protein